MTTVFHLLLLVSSPPPPLSFFLPGGLAGRREDGVGGWLFLYILLVRVEFGFPLWVVGHVPFWSLSMALARGVTALVMLCLFAMAAWCCGWLRSFASMSPSIISHLSVPVLADWAWLRQQFVCHRGGDGEVLLERGSRSCLSGRSSSSSACLEKLRRPPEGGRWAAFSAGKLRRLLISGRWAAFLASSAILLAEGQPYPYLPAMMPNGRQTSNWLEAMASCRGSLVVPSDLFPGDGEVQSDRKLRTRLRFFNLVPGLFCKVQGLCCNLMLSVCLGVKFVLCTFVVFK